MQSTIFIEKRENTFIELTVTKNYIIRFRAPIQTKIWILYLSAFSNFVKENELPKSGGHKHYTEFSHSEIPGEC